MATAFQSTAFQNNAFQIDGGSPTPTPTPTSDSIGSKWVRQTSQAHQFTRKKWRELMEALEAERALERRAEETKQAKKKAALDQAAQAAAYALAQIEAQERVETAELDRQLIELKNALDGASSATKVSASIRNANVAIEIARQIADDDEEETIILLALH